MKADDQETVVCPRCKENVAASRRHAPPPPHLSGEERRAAERGISVEQLRAADERERWNTKVLGVPPYQPLSAAERNLAAGLKAHADEKHPREVPHVLEQWAIERYVEAPKRDRKS